MATRRNPVFREFWAVSAHSIYHIECIDVEGGRGLEPRVKKIAAARNSRDSMQVGAVLTGGTHLGISRSTLLMYTAGPERLRPHEVPELRHGDSAGEIFSLFDSDIPATLCFRMFQRCVLDTLWCRVNTDHTLRLIGEEHPVFIRAMGEVD
jgi:hypothetical protein